jgi:anti-sigma regulatory factor (Ser/Thr protein kinase)
MNRLVSRGAPRASERMRVSRVLPFPRATASMVEAGAAALRELDLQNDLMGEIALAVFEAMVKAAASQG